MYLVCCEIHSVSVWYKRLPVQSEQCVILCTLHKRFDEFSSTNICDTLVAILNGKVRPEPISVRIVRVQVSESEAVLFESIFLVVLKVLII
jgi:hypothetical protein